MKKIPKPRIGDVLTAINRAFSEGDEEAWGKMMSHKTYPLCKGCLFKKEVSE